MDQNQQMEMFKNANMKTIDQKVDVELDEWTFDEKIGKIIVESKRRIYEKQELTPIGVKAIVGSWEQAVGEANKVRPIINACTTSRLDTLKSSKDILDQFKTTIDTADKYQEHLDKTKAVRKQMHDWVERQAELEKSKAVEITSVKPPEPKA